jgi:hypothetical protein
MMPRSSRDFTNGICSRRKSIKHLNLLNIVIFTEIISLSGPETVTEGASNRTRSVPMNPPMGDLTPLLRERS